MLHGKFPRWLILPIIEFLIEIMKCTGPCDSYGVCNKCSFYVKDIVDGCTDCLEDGEA